MHSLHVFPHQVCSLTTVITSTVTVVNCLDTATKLMHENVEVEIEAINQATEEVKEPVASNVH